MNCRFSPLILAFLSLATIGATFSGCSPRLTVDKYSYLIEGRETGSRPATAARPRKAASSRPAISPDAPVMPESTGSLADLPSRRRRTNETDLIIETAQSYIGTPYRYGGMSRMGVDCSGLVCLSYQAANKSLPRTSTAMARTGREVPMRNLEPGHLVFFDAKNGRNINHVGMVVENANGDIRFIHATSSAGVRIDRLNDPYWKVRYRKAMAP